MRPPLSFSATRITHTTLHNIPFASSASLFLSSVSLLPLCSTHCVFRTQVRRNRYTSPLPARVSYVPPCAVQSSTTLLHPAYIHRATTCSTHFTPILDLWLTHIYVCIISQSLYVRVRALIHAYLLVYACLSVCIGTYMYAYARVCLCLCARMCVRACACTRFRMFARLLACVVACMCACAHTRTRVRSCLRALCVRVCVHVCACTCVCVRARTCTCLCARVCVRAYVCAIPLTHPYISTFRTSLSTQHINDTPCMLIPYSRINTIVPYCRWIWTWHYTINCCCMLLLSGLTLHPLMLLVTLLCIMLTPPDVFVMLLLLICAVLNFIQTT